MSEIKKCEHCQATESNRFRPLKASKWDKAEPAKKVKVSVEEVDSVGMVDHIEAVKTLAKIFYEREYTMSKGPVYSYDKLQEVFQDNHSLKEFLNQLYLAARPLELTEQTIGRMKKLIVHICYLLASLNNTIINAFKFDLMYYLDSVDAHDKYVENALSKYLDKAFVLNIDDYHNIHVPRSLILLLIIKHLDEQFIINLGIPYHEHCQNYRGECSDDELLEQLTLHSYNDRLVEKKSDRHIQNVILFDFVGSNLKRVEDYTKALQIVYNQELMQEYFSNHVIPIATDWPGQFFIRKAIAHRILLENEFGNTCKNIEFLYLTNLLSNLIPLVLDVYAVHHRGGNWAAYEETCLCCWSDLFLRFDRRNYKCAPLMFFQMDEIKTNFAALMVSMTKDLAKNEFVDESAENTVEDESDDAEAVLSDIEVENNLLENAKNAFLNL
ncbi:hypothetical protein C2G38_2173079 [Gigaspora rosea]|uniref:Uncharacterized protein n=1 Tax=Gigaspora rosea TaxID=44941 RepID=A0A397VUR7_9GLOM|nr:hypothetical protein C2G38_2173079 [Gigaspora rosea]